MVNGEFISIDDNTDILHFEGIADFPITKFEDRGDFYYATDETGEKASISVPNNLDLSYSTVALANFVERGNILPIPIYMYDNNYAMYKQDDINNIELAENLTFSGSSLLSFFYFLPPTEDNPEGKKYSSKEPISGTVDMVIKNGGEYDLTMNFDNFYTINTDGTKFTLSNWSNVSSDWKDDLKLIVKENDNYTVNNRDDIEFVVLGKDKENLEEIIGKFMGVVGDGKTGSLTFGTSFGAVRK